VPQERVLPRQEDPVIYEIPDNTIPTTEAIEKQIAETKAFKEVERDAGAKMREERLQEAPQKTQTASIPAPPAPAAEKKDIVKILPAKKEFNFPTYEERRKNKPRSNIV